MPKYAILRFHKLKSRETIAFVCHHNDRQHPLPPNVDPAKQDNNRSLIGNPAIPLAERIDQRLVEVGIDPTKQGGRRVKGRPKQLHNDAVLAIEIFAGFSPEKLRDPKFSVDGWITDTLEWIRQLFGPDNIVSGVYHGDEKTPHLQCVAVPLVGGKLSAKKVIGGHRSRAVALQTSYWEAVKGHGLARGIPAAETKRKHLAKRDLEKRNDQIILTAEEASKELAQPPKIVIPEKGFLESTASHEAKVQQSVDAEWKRRIEDSHQLKALTDAATKGSLYPEEKSAHANTYAALKQAKHELEEKKNKEEELQQTYKANVESEAQRMAQFLERDNHEKIRQLEQDVINEKNDAAKEKKGKEQAEKSLSLAQAEIKEMRKTAREIPTIEAAEKLAGKKAISLADGFAEIEIGSRIIRIAPKGSFRTTEGPDPITGDNAIDLIMRVMACKLERAVAYLAHAFQPNMAKAKAIEVIKEKADAWIENSKDFSHDEKVSAGVLPRPQQPRMAPKVPRPPTGPKMKL